MPAAPEAADPYAAIAAAYDAEFEDAGADIAGYARRGVPGRLLVGGCGTGRVCRALAAVRPVVGLDRSAPMIARARALGGGAEYVVADLTDFALGPFTEIVIPNGSFAFLPDRRAQAACLAACARALPPGAPLTIDVPMPDFGLLADAHTPERPAWEGIVAGRRIRRTREVFRDPVAQRLRLVDRYYPVPDGGEGDGEPPGPLHCGATSELRLSLIYPREAEWMLEAAGFYLESAWGDHAQGPLRPGCDRLLLAAVRG